MAKLKTEILTPEVEADTIQETTQETDISQNSTNDAQTITATDTVTDTATSATTDVESKPTTTTATESRAGTGAKNSPESKTVTPKQNEKTKLSTQKGTEKPSKEDPDDFTLEVLKAYRNYESLYVDRLGCVYTIDTPVAIRGLAVLYKNPHFKS